MTNLATSSSSPMNRTATNFKMRIKKLSFNKSDGDELTNALCSSNTSKEKLQPGSLEKAWLRRSWSESSVTTIKDSEPIFPSNRSSTSSITTCWSNESRSSLSTTLENLIHEKLQQSFEQVRPTSPPFELSSHELDDLCLQFADQYVKNVADGAFDHFTLIPDDKQERSYKNSFRSICICNPVDRRHPIQLKSRYFSLGPTRNNILDLNASKTTLSIRREVTNRPIFVLEYRTVLTSNYLASTDCYVLAAQLDLTSAIQRLTKRNMQLQPHASRSTTSSIDWLAAALETQDLDVELMRPPETPQEELHALVEDAARGFADALMLVPGCDNWDVVAVSESLAAEPEDVDVAFARTDAETLLELGHGLAAGRAVEGVKVRWGVQGVARRVWCVPMVDCGSGKVGRVWCCFLLDE